MHSTGVYAWWDERGELAQLWPSGMAPVDPGAALRVGQARIAFSERAMKMHLSRNHFSALRRNLARSSLTGSTCSPARSSQATASTRCSRSAP